MSASEWQPIATAPREEEFLATDGNLFGVGHYSSTVEPDETLLGYDEGFTIGGHPAVGPRFCERVPNPKAGEVREWFGAFAMHSFTGADTMNDESDPAFFTPTHWMPLPKPPSPERP